MHSRYANGILTITMQNRYAQVDQTNTGDFRSTKSDGELGLLSIRSIAEKHGGGCRFTLQGDQFVSLVYLQIRQGCTVPERKRRPVIR